MTNPFAAILEEILSEALAGGQDKVYRQVSAEERAEFSSLHQMAHFLRDRISEELAGMLIHTNLSQMLVGEPDSATRKLTIEGACEDKPSDREYDTGERNPMTVSVKLGNETVMAVRVAFYPTV